ncbi:MAG: N-6 DNA methylase [Puniceicoccales bacterium]|jgi:type I restriction enzyme M protein|nr:N-6 DNA methylase [Puniceicoccales bacterium]
MKKRIDNCRDILAAKLPLPTDQIELITFTLLYKYLDEQDAETAAQKGRRAFFVGGLSNHRWERLADTKITSAERVERFCASLAALGDPQKAAQLPALFREIFSAAILKFRDERTFTLFLDAVNSLPRANKNELADIIEYLLRTLGAQGDNVQFRTPRHIARFMVECLNPVLGERILDPACGTGGFLISCFRHILGANTTAGDGVSAGDKLSPADLQMLNDDLRGYDNADLMVKLCKVNLFLHGIAEPNVRLLDTLADGAHWDERADIIFANPPFMTPRGGISPHGKFRLRARKAEVLFLDYIATHIGPNGRAAVIVPNGIVANVQTIFTTLRHHLVNETLAAVVSLPAGVFKPYTGIKTSILFLDRRIARDRGKTLFVNIANDGFDLGNKRTPIRRNDLPAAVKLLREWLAPDADAAAFEARLAEQKQKNPRVLVVSRDTLLDKPDATLSFERFARTASANPRYRRVTLGEVCKIASGGTPARTSPEFWENGSIPWISSKNIGDDHRVSGGEPVTEEAIKQSAARLVHPGTLLLVTRVSVGRWALATGDIAINQDITALTSSTPDLLDEFLPCIAPRVAEKIDRGAVGTAIRGVARDFVRNLEIALPDIETQRQILRDIANYREIIKGARGILGAFATDMQPDPKWPLASLGEVAELEYGLPVAAGDEGETRYIRITDIDDYGLLNEGDGKFVTIGEDDKRYLVRAGDVFIARVGGTAGKTLFVPEDQNSVFASYLIRARFDERMLPKFFWYYSRTQPYWEQRQQLLSGCGQAQFNASAIRQINVPCPSLDVQREVVARLDAEFAQISTVRDIVATYTAKTNAVLDQLWTEK